MYNLIYLKYLFHIIIKVILVGKLIILIRKNNFKIYTFKTLKSIIVATHLKKYPLKCLNIVASIIQKRITLKLKYNRQNKSYQLYI